ncbi:hypothetical protein ABPG72_008620 [Tetrahymena utriculariae]
MQVNQRKNSDREFQKVDIVVSSQVQTKDDLELNVEQNEKMYLFMLFLIGIINNTGYVLVGTAAQDIANKFDMKNFMTLFQLSLIVLSGVMRSINSKFFIKISHKKRIFVCIVLSIGAFIIIAFSSKANGKWGFYTCLVGSVMCGTMQAFGESVMLGYLKVFPSRLVAGWSSGTGFAGPFGSGLLLVLKAVNLDLYIIFLIMIPIEASYWLCFLWYDNRKKRFYKSNQIISESNCSESQQGEETQQQLIESNIFIYNFFFCQFMTEEELSEQQNENKSITIKESDDDDDAKNNKKLSIQNIKSVMPKMWILAVNLGLVYYLEYVIETVWAERAHPQLDSDQYSDDFNGFLEKNGFVILCFCYQIGVFISRSSLYLIKIQKVFIFTSAQAANFGLWIFFAINKSVPMGVQIPCMIFVGLMGGASYVNVNYLLLNHKEIDRNEKELAMNICSIFNDTGVLLSSLSGLVIDNFILKD